MQSSFQCAFGSGTLIAETGKLAQQANGAVLLKYGECAVLVTATMSKPREGIDFFPLTVDFEERMYAQGNIPGNYFRREGRPSTHGTLTARLTDRPIRPLFPKGFRNEVQIIIMPMSLDEQTPVDIFAIVGASIALTISDIPFEGPIGATRMGYRDGEFIVNPTYSEILESELDIVVAGSRGGVVMMEAGAHQVPESVVVEAVERAQEANLRIIEMQEQMATSIGLPNAEFEADAYPVQLDEQLASAFEGKIVEIFEQSPGKSEQSGRIRDLQNDALSQFGDQYEAKHIMAAFDWLLEQEFKVSVLDRGLRPDGRGVKEIRPLSAEVALLPRVHGSGLFSRGETQILGITTLGSVGDA